jgi:glycine/D-amino acid oxidase-like deaminating enzyme
MSSGTRIVICGGGAIGAAIAYFTSRRGARPTVIERHAVAGAASGKSGGFLALDWCGGSPLDRWRGGASNSMPNFPPNSAIRGVIGV